MDIPPLSSTYYRPFPVDAGTQVQGVADHQDGSIPVTKQVGPVGSSEKTGSTDKSPSEPDLPSEKTLGEEGDTAKTSGSKGEDATQANNPEQQAELQKIRELQQRDREVRAHEAAHAAVGGHLTGSPSFSFERGPDGVNYAVSGEVSVVSPSVTGDPETTLQQAEQVQRAALAPADPSPQDRKVAAEAARTAADARLQLMQLNSEKAGSKNNAEVSIESRVAGETHQPGDEERRQAIRAYESGDNPLSLTKAIDARV